MIEQGRRRLRDRARSRGTRRHHLYHGAGHARCRKGAVRRRTASRRASAPGKIVVDMSTISPLATKDFAQRIEELGCFYVDSPVSGGEVGAKAGTLTLMVGGAGGNFRTRQAAVPVHGQDHHADRRQRRRSDGQSGQPDHCRAQHRSRRRSAAVRLQGRRRSGQGAPGVAWWISRNPASSKCMASAC